MKSKHTGKALALLACIGLFAAGCKSDTYGGGPSPKEPPAPKAQPKPPQPPAPPAPAAK